MRRVEQRERIVGAGLRHRVVPQVRGEERVHARGANVVEEAVLGAAADRDGPHQRLGVARDADALRGRGQPLGGPGGELAHGERMVQLADPAEATASLGVGRVGHEGPYDPQVQGPGQRVADSRVGTVGVGVGDVQRDVVLDQRVHDAALEGVGRHRRRTAQIERVVGDEQVGVQFHRLVDDVLDRVDGEQDARDVLVGVAADGTDRVPPLGPLRRPEGVERGDDFRQTGHGEKATCLTSLSDRSWPTGPCRGGLRTCGARAGAACGTRIPPVPARVFPPWFSTSAPFPQANPDRATLMCEATARRSPVCAYENYLRRRR